MAEGPPERPGIPQLPHLVVPWLGQDHSYRGRGGGGLNPVRAIGDRGQHASRLKAELSTAEETARELQADVTEEVRADGFALAVEGWSDEPGYSLALQSLDANGAKLLSVVPGTEQSAERAVVWLPYGAVERFFARIDEFATAETSKGKPRHESLVANIEELRLAILRDLWQEADAFPAPEEPLWWEVWLVRLTAESDPGAVLRAIAGARGWPVVNETLTFPDSVVVLVHTTANELSTILNTSATPRELHHARVTSEILRVEHSFQGDLVFDLRDRIEAASPTSAAVCVLDTGVMSGHPLLQSSVDSVQSALSGTAAGDLAGHGTEMSGLALLGNLDSCISGKDPVRLRHRLESVKVLRGDERDAATDPELYGTITATAAAQAELAQQRRRAFSMAVTADGVDGSDGRPTSYSASLDALAFGTDIRRSDDGVELLGQPDPQAARLFVVSAGNIRRDAWKSDHLAVSDVTRVQNPAQAWNVLTVGAYTDLVQTPSDQMFLGWTALAPAGELSPFSRTSMTFGGSWPIKPDILLEGGNLLAAPGAGQFDTHDDVSLLTTSNNDFRLLTTANATSAATAQAARLAAIAMEQYPSLRPETVRALLVHAAEWTPAMHRQFDGVGASKGSRLRMLRRYGWGAPTEQRVLNSASSSVTLIIQDEFLPFERGEKSGIKMRAFRLHQLPWPQEQLRDLFGTKVRLRVTLSYFVCQHRLKIDPFPPGEI